MDYDQEYYVIYDKENDEYMEYTDWGDGDIDEFGYSRPDVVVHFESQDEADNARKKFSNADSLVVVKVKVTFDLKECD